MKRKITGFDTDENDDWRARPACGHYRHVRQRPPLITREWVLSEDERDSRPGLELECKNAMNNSLWVLIRT